jgi:membrane protein DedA with SNARE-associated domain
VIAGDNSLYFIGRGVGSNLLAFFGLKKSKSPGADPSSKIDRLHVFMERHGHLAIFYARFFAGFRALVYLSAGSLGVPPGRFFLYDLAGAAISVPVVVTLGYVFGQQIEQVIHYVGGFQKVLWIVIALGALIYLARLAVIRLSASGAKT